MPLKIDPTLTPQKLLPKITRLFELSAQKIVSIEKTWKPEITVEGRNYQEQQVFTTSGTFPDLHRTSFSHYSQRMDATFASIVYPTKHFTIGAYYHEPLRNEGTGQVVPVTNTFTGQIKTNVPNFFFQSDGQGNRQGNQP